MQANSRATRTNREEKNRNKHTVGLELGKIILACSEWATPLSPPLMKVHTSQLCESIWSRREKRNHSRTEGEFVLPLMNGTMPRQLLHKCQKWDLCCFNWIPLEVSNYRWIPHFMGFCRNMAMLATCVFFILKLKPWWETGLSNSLAQQLKNICQHFYTRPCPARINSIPDLCSSINCKKLHQYHNLL